MSRLKSRIALVLSALLIVVAADAGRAETVSKPPDVGPYWYPLNPSGGTYVYANSFVAPVGGTVTDLGMWLTDEATGGTNIRFEVYGSIGGNPANGPDTTNVLASTGVLSGLGIGPLAYYNAPVAGGTPLTAGNTYWFAGNVVGESGPGYFKVGGHTQNSVVVDNGTFWYSNDVNGVFFDGIYLTPEMAFSVTVTPEPSTVALVSLALLGLATRRQRGA